jgi:hypothetical protein
LFGWQKSSHPLPSCKQAWLPSWSQESNVSHSRVEPGAQTETVLIAADSRSPIFIDAATTGAA